MNCEQCGGSLEMFDQVGQAEYGPFGEAYRCASCGAEGVIEGRAEKDPATWTYRGRALNK
jgi:uncharacterized Zn finger protein